MRHCLSGSERLLRAPAVKWTNCIPQRCGKEIANLYRSNSSLTPPDWMKRAFFSCPTVGISDTRTDCQLPPWLEDGAWPKRWAKKPMPFTGESSGTGIPSSMLPSDTRTSFQTGRCQAKRKSRNYFKPSSQIISTLRTAAQHHNNITT